MDLTRDDLQEYIYNPQIMQKLILEEISTASDGEYTISDPTNPFTFLLECCCVNASNAAIEANNIIRKKYPSLANVEDDLYHHLDDDTVGQIGAQPSEAVIDFRVSVVDLKNNGYRPAGAVYVQTTIPYHTVVTVLDVPFTLLNNIVVRLYDNGSIHCEQEINSDNDLAYDDIGVLNSQLFYSSDGTPWIWFKTKVKQISRSSAEYVVTVSDGFIKGMAISDKYVDSHVTYRGSITNNKDVVINKTLNEDYIDPYTATVYIEPYVNEIVYRIPEVYLVEGMVSGTVTINTYTTKGKLYLPINRFDTSDYTVTYGETTQNESTATITNIPVVCNSTAVVDGGTDKLTAMELRDLVINNSAITNSLPITDKQIERLVSLYGFAIYRMQDVLTNRTYLCLKSLPDLASGSSSTESDLLYAKQDVLFNTVRVKLSDVQNYTDSILISDDETQFVIKSNTLFKYNNGVIEIVSPEEKTRLDEMGNTKLINTLKEQKYYYTPYYYIITTDADKTDCYVYDLDTPDIASDAILNKNNNVNPTVNIDKWLIFKTTYGYRVQISLAESTEFSNIPKEYVKLQMKLPLYSGTSYAYIDSVYYADAGCFVFDLYADVLLDENDRFTLTNGYSDTATMKFDLTADILIYTMSNSPDITDDTGFLNSEIYNPDGSNWVVYTKECIKTTFGKKYDYIYTNIYNVYDTRKWKTYENSIIDTYSKPIFQRDASTGSPFSCNKLANTKHAITFNIIHKKGEQKLDADGNPIYLQRKGDNILDDDGNPTVDVVGGVIRYIDILMLEYEYLRANSTPYENYRKLTLENLETYITETMTTINDSLLENTLALYKSYKTSKSIPVTISGTIENIPYNISPNVTLYLENATDIDSTLQETYIKQIGNIINKHLDSNTIKLETIKSEIKEKLGSNVIGVKITGIDPDDSEVITITNTNNKLLLNKILNINSANELIVKYDITLTVQTL